MVKHHLLLKLMTLIRDLSSRRFRSAYIWDQVLMLIYIFNVIVTKDLDCILLKSSLRGSAHQF